MTDVFSKDKRSWIMSRVKGRDTKPEILVRSFVHRMGFRFRVHRRDLPGNPDIVLPRHGKVIFVHGCFWHGHGCSKGQAPKSRADYWLPKIDANRERDRRNVEALEALGWSVRIVWQCELRDPEALLDSLGIFLAER